MSSNTIYAIYKATAPNGKSYIGFTKNLHKRKIDHKCQAKKKNSSCKKFHNSIRKYGFENFTWEILYQSPSRDTTLKVVETYYINIYNTISEGLNISSGGECPPSQAGKNYQKNINENYH